MISATTCLVTLAALLCQSASAKVYTLDPFLVAWNQTALALSVAHRDDPSRVLFASPGGARPFLAAAQVKAHSPPVTTDGGYNCGFDDKSPLKACETTAWMTADQTAAVVHYRATAPSSLLLSGVLHRRGQLIDVPYEVELASASDDDGSPYLRFSARLQGSEIVADSRIFLSFRSPPDEKLFGFGQQYSVWDQKGSALPLLVTEQGVGRGVQPLTEAINLFGGKCGGNHWTTYGPAPLFIGASRGNSNANGKETTDYRALLLEGSAFSLFDMRSDTEVIRAEVWGRNVSGRVLYAPSTAVVQQETPPLTLLRGISAYTGRMKPLPPWVDTGAIIGMEGGKGTVLNITETLIKARVPIAAIWLQDWTGERHLAGGDRLWWNWESDDTTYPDWVGMVARLRADHGVRVLSYVNPYLVNASTKASGCRRNLLQEASDAGYLVQRSAAAGGGNYMLQSGSKKFEFGTVDLSSPAAATWFAQVIVDNMLRPAGKRNATGGVSGWMHDFGEYLPFDAVTFLPPSLPS